MSRIITLALAIGLLGWLESCSAPEQPTASVYPEDKRISSPDGVPRDSTINYFPASASINTRRDSMIRKQGNCEFMFQMVSKELFGFKAPVLSNYHLGHSIYRFLWAPALRLPVLITLDLSETNGILKTQSVNRYPEPMYSYAQVEAKSQPAIKRIDKLKSLISAGQDVSDNTERLASATLRLDEIKLSGTPLVITEKVVLLSRVQTQQFVEMLDQAKFWQLPSCEPSECFDGVDYTLEAHEANRYHMVQRGCFVEKRSGFYQCCKFLLDLSPANPEEQH